MASQNVPFKAIIALLISLNVSACASTARWIDVPINHEATAPTIVDPTAVEQTQVSATRMGFPPRTRPSNEVAPGYLIEIRSPDPSLSSTYRIDFNHQLKLPYNVRLTTEGLTERQLTTAVQNAYRSYFRRAADVRVAVAKKEFLINVQGLVKNPGHYAFEHDSSLDDIIALAGGLQDSNSPDLTPRYARIKSPSATSYIRLADYHSGIAASKAQWQGGEIVFFQTQGPLSASSSRVATASDSIRIVGQVVNPSEYSVEKNADFFTYLLRAGGPTDRADLSNILLVRRDEGRTRALAFSMYNLTSLPAIQPGDAIIINSDVPSAFERKTRVGANIASIISALGLVAIAGN